MKCGNDVSRNREYDDGGREARGRFLPNPRTSFESFQAAGLEFVSERSRVGRLMRSVSTRDLFGSWVNRPRNRPRAQ